MEYDAEGNLAGHSEASGENVPRYYRQFMYSASTGDVDSMFINYIDEDVVTDCYKMVFHFNSFHNPDSAIITNVCVFNSVGQLVQQKNIPQPQQVDTIDIGSLASGVYYLRIVNTEGARVFAGSVVRY